MTLSRTRCNGRVLTPNGTMESRSYDLIEEMGRGAAATVYRARDRSTGREVAVKVLHEEHMGHSKAIARFLQERSILLSLQHDNIVRVRDLLTTNEHALALVMDLVQGGNLRDLLAQRGTLPVSEAAMLMAQVADGLGAAHAQSVVHRDLKPDNILIDRDLDGRPRVRITDFGIARVLDSPGMTTPGAVVGTPNYMAPELIQGEGDPTPAVDVYALGMMFYELMVGRPPYADSVQTAILMRHLRGAPRRRAGIPKPAWTLFSACTSRNPARRPTATVLSGLLRRLAAETAGMGALPVLPDAPAVTTPRPRRALSASLVVLAIVVAVTLGAGGRYLFGGDRPKADAAVRAQPAASSVSVTPLPGRGQVGRSPAAAPAGLAATPSADRAGAPPSAAAGERPAPVAEAAPAGNGAPAKVPPPAAVTSWRCPSGYRWPFGHLALAKPCYKIGPSIQAMGNLKASSGVRVDVTVALEDVDSKVELPQTRTCPAMTFTKTTTEQSCGPLDVSPPRGHRYVVVMRWKYTDKADMPAATVRGDPLAW